MKIHFTLIFILTCFPLWGQLELDTIKVYNVHCSYTEGNSVVVWGGNYNEFYPSEECPKDAKTKYIENHKKVSDYMSDQVFFWMKLYDTENHLIYEGLKYSDCMVGRFICYYPSGRIKVTGEYGGYEFKKETGYKLIKCSGGKKGVWNYYDEHGKKVNTIDYH